MADQQMDAELQQFLAMEQQKAKIQEYVNELTDVCWEKCVDKVGKSHLRNLWKSP